MNSTDEHLEFKITEETNNTINYLDMTINRNVNGMEIAYIENIPAQMSQFNTPRTTHRIINMQHMDTT